MIVMEDLSQHWMKNSFEQKMDVCRLKILQTISGMIIFYRTILQLAILSLVFLIPVKANAQSRAAVLYWTNSQKLAVPNLFIFTNVIAGTNIITWTNGDGSITIAGTVVGGGSGDAGGTNSRQGGSLLLTNLANNPYTGYTNIYSSASFNLSPRPDFLPSTNYASILSSFGVETVYARTNAEGANVAVGATWQGVFPSDYVSNSLTLTLNSILLNTNGPNSSNTIFAAYLSVFPTGSTNDYRMWANPTPAYGTNTWSASYTGTNKVQSVTITFTNATGGAQAGDLFDLKIERANTLDTFVGWTSLLGPPRLNYLRQ